MSSMQQIFNDDLNKSKPALKRNDNNSIINKRKSGKKMDLDDTSTKFTQQKINPKRIFSNDHDVGGPSGQIS
jgi:hypothetical protein